MAGTYESYVDLTALHLKRLGQSETAAAHPAASYGASEAPPH